MPRRIVASGPERDESPGSPQPPPSDFTVLLNNPKNPVPAPSAPEIRAAPATHVFKTVGSLSIRADVHLSPAARRPAPVIVYTHGGSLIGGGREKISKCALLPVFLDAGCAIVSIDYRLAPETKLQELVLDVEDAFRWVREQGPALFGADPDRIAAWGSSAGGYLAFLAGHRVTPRPRVLLVEYGYADIIGSWQTQPSHHADHYKHPPMSEADAWKLVSGPPIANVSDRPIVGGIFNGWVRQRGLWPKAVTGWNPLSEPDRFRPLLPVRNVSGDYPPTFILHGREDTDIPYSVAEEMAAELARNSVEHRLIGIPGGEHGYRGAAPAAIASAHRTAAEFVLNHLRPAEGFNQS